MTVKLLAALLSVAAALPSLAAAADYDPPIYVEQEEYTPVEVGSGWYLRGDIGYVVSNSVSTYTYRTFDPVGMAYGGAVFDSNELKQDLTFGGGFGYRYNEWVRGDVTVEGFQARFSGTTYSDSPCLPDATYDGTTCRSEDAASMSAISLMANGYLDLGTYVGLTPYVGAGAGMTYVSWSGLNNSTFCRDDVNPCPVGAIPATTHGGAKDWRFTYAFMAGVAYDVTKNVKIDLGYKYKHIDGGSMFNWDEGSAAAGATGVQGYDGDLEQHEVKVGLRYELW